MGGSAEASAQVDNGNLRLSDSVKISVKFLGEPRRLSNCPSNSPLRQKQHREKYRFDTRAFRNCKIRLNLSFSQRSLR